LAILDRLQDIEFVHRRISRILRRIVDPQLPCQRSSVARIEEQRIRDVVPGRPIVSLKLVAL
jgi:hypothetical protein